MQLSCKKEREKTIQAARDLQLAVEAAAAPLLQAPDFADEVSVAGGVGLDDILDVVGLEGLFEPPPRRHVLELQRVSCRCLSLFV